MLWHVCGAENATSAWLPHLQEALPRVAEQVRVIATCKEAQPFGRVLARCHAHSAHVMRVRALACEVRPGLLLAISAAALWVRQALKDRHLGVHACRASATKVVGANHREAAWGRPTGTLLSYTPVANTMLPSGVDASCSTSAWCCVNRASRVPNRPSQNCTFPPLSPLQQKKPA